MTKEKRKQCRVAMLGYGNAGQAFARILLDRYEEIVEKTGTQVLITTIVTGSRGCLRDPQGIDLAEATRQLTQEGRFDAASPAYFEGTAMEVVEEGDYDVLMELTPLNIATGQPAIDHLKKAMLRGKHAISANKGPIAWAYRELRDLAREQGVHFFFETTVMAGVPLFNMADYCLDYARVSQIEGIFNATTNYILRQMELGVPRDVIYEQGRAGGFMEADPSMDVDGWDATAKLTALLNVLMDAGITPDDVERVGIGEVTQEEVQAAVARGKKLKLICRGRMEGGRVQASVKPEEIPETDAFAGPDVVAVVSITTDLMDKITLVQYGLETTQTGYGVFIDLMRVLREGF